MGTALIVAKLGYMQTSRGSEELVIQLIPLRIESHAKLLWRRYAVATHRKNRIILIYQIRRSGATRLGGW